MLSEQLYLFFIVFIHVIPGTWSISKCCPNSIRISSWLRNSHCGKRRSYQRLISAVGLFPAIWRLFYIESLPGCIFSTQTRNAGISSKINCCGMTCWKRNQNVSVTWQHANFFIIILKQHEPWEQSCLNPALNPAWCKATYWWLTNNCMSPPQWPLNFGNCDLLLSVLPTTIFADEVLSITPTRMIKLG